MTSSSDDKEKNAASTPLIPQLTPTDRDIAALNHLLKDEIAAVETYEQCVSALSTSSAVGALQDLKTSHARRRDLLRTKIHELGGEAASGSGAWGALARLLEGGAAMLSERAALRVLVKEEQHENRDYHRLDDVTEETRAFIRSKIVPEQVRTQARLAELTAGLE